MFHQEQQAQCLGEFQVQRRQEERLIEVISGPLRIVIVGDSGLGQHFEVAEKRSSGDIHFFGQFIGAMGTFRLEDRHQPQDPL